MRRLPRPIERELAKFLGTIGFKDYGRLLWDLPDDTRPAKPAAPLAPDLCRQILDQARHDPSVVAFGASALPKLQRHVRDLISARGFSAADLLDGVEAPVEVALIVPRLDAPTTDRLATLLPMLRQAGATSFLVIVSDEQGIPRHAGALGADVSVLSWRDRYGGPAHIAARNLALFVDAIGSPAIISLNDRLGLEMIGQYGRALKTVHHLYVALDVATDAPLTNIYHLRQTAPHATLLALSETEADALRAHSAGLDGPGVAVLTDDAAKVFGLSFEDQRSDAARKVTARLLERDARPIEVASPAPAPADTIDITVTITFHNERELAVPALASLREMVEAARREGIKVEARAVLDNGDDAMRRIIRQHGTFLDDIREVAFGDAAAARNAGTQAASGRYLAFLDGDDLWGTDWLVRAYRAAEQSDDPARTIWHPAAYLAFWASDCDRASTTAEPNDSALTALFLQQSDDAPGFEPRDLLFESAWTPSCLAPRALHLRFPYRLNDYDRQIGIEDWRFNLETLGHAVRHRVVPDTVHLFRMKEGGSFGQMHQARALLPLLD